MKTTIAFGKDVWTASVILAQKINPDVSQYQALGRVAPRAFCFAVSCDGRPLFTLLDSLGGFNSISHDGVEQFALWLEAAAPEPLSPAPDWTPIQQGHALFGHALAFAADIMAFDHKFTATLDWWADMADRALAHRTNTQPDNATDTDVLRGTTEGA